MFDNDLVMQAKESLGLKNAEWISELLGLQKYDVRNRKALCPYHNEKTPSFVYNEKTYQFHCFGCGKTVDIIDVLIEKGDTYLSAVEKLFEKAGMSVAIGEKGIKTKHSYKYPQEEKSEDKQKVYDYYKLRKISKETLDYCGVSQDSKGNIAFNYYDVNDVCTLVKYRPARKIEKGENKCWCQKGADTASILFNMNKINTTQPLLITEGESDCLAAIECGYKNTVSVPFGAGNYKWIEENLEWLDSFQSIIICSDNDASGEKMLKECTSRLGNYRIRIVDLPKETPNGKKLKDLNECLVIYGKEETYKRIISAKETPVTSVIDFAEIESIDYSTLDGITTGFNRLDKMLFSLQYGTFNVLTGVNGSGKSSFLCQVMCEAIEKGNPCWLYSGEMPNSMMKNWLESILAGPRHIKEKHNYFGAKFYETDPAARSPINKKYKDLIKFYRDGVDSRLQTIYSSMTDSVRKLGCKLFILDNLTTINLDCNDTEKWSKQLELVQFLISFAKTYNVVVILVIHPHKIEKMRRLSKFDIQGYSALIDLAHRVFSLYRVQPQDLTSKYPLKHNVMFDILKDRLTGKEGASFGFYYDNASRRFYQTNTEYNRQYSWDKAVYTDILKHPYSDGFYLDYQQNDDDDEENETGL